MVVTLLVSLGERRVVYLVESPFSQRDSDRFGVKTLRARGFTPEAWNVGPIYLPNAQRQFAPPATDIACLDVTDLDELRARVRLLSSDDAVISMIGAHPGQVRKYRRVHQVLAQSASRYGVLAAGPVIDAGPITHSSPRQRRIRDGLFKTIRRNNRLAQNVLAVYRYLLRLRCLDFAWVATSVNLIDPVLMNRRTRTTFIHSLDYDLVLRESLSTPLSLGPPLLIDDMGPSHPDFTSLEDAEAGDLDTDEYFRRLCLVLGALEDHLGTSIEVAAHPRAEPGSAEVKYAGRRVYYGETAKRIRRSSLVILTGASTAVGMAVAWSKPIIMIRADGIHAYERARNDALVSALDLPVWQFGGFLRRDNWSQTSRDLYEAYMERFVKRRGTPEMPFWTVVADSLSRAELRR